MRDNETGEYELVVGNKQLLSGFFIVVVLCAVAFALGYVVGQNAPRTARMATDQQPQSGSAQDARPQPASPALSAANPPAVQSPAPSTPAESTDPANAGSAAASTTPAPPPQPTTQPARDATSPAATPAAPAPAPTEAPPGSWWQVLATRNQESARALVQTLKDKGLPASLTVGTDNLTRVLVGPYTDTASMARAKTALESAGFQPVRK
jgi:cell division septation protein DedD